jgi:hypothetical protein
VTEPRLINLSFDGFASETVEVHELAPGRFRLAETPVLADPPLYLGDVIEAQADERGVYQFQRVVERSSFQSHNWLLSRQVMKSEAMAVFKMVIEQSGGCWEQLFGGLLVVHLPADAPFEVERELDEVITQVRSQSATS